MGKNSGVKRQAPNKFNLAPLATPLLAYRKITEWNQVTGTKIKLSRQALYRMGLFHVFRLEGSDLRALLRSL
jgi:hypothetical protein